MHFTDTSVSLHLRQGLTAMMRWSTHQDYLQLWSQANCVQIIYQYIITSVFHWAWDYVLSSGFFPRVLFLCQPWKTMAGILVKNHHKQNQKGKHNPYIHMVLPNEANRKILRTGVFKCWYDFSKTWFLEVPGPKIKHASCVCWKYGFRNNTKIFYQGSWLIQNVSVSSCCSLYYFMYVYYVNGSVNMQGTPGDLLLYLQTWSCFFHLSSLTVFVSGHGT